MIYRTKIVEIEAHLWDGDWQELADWADRCSDGNGTTLLYDGNFGILTVRTLEGDMVATRGDYVICGLEGEFYFCKPAIFHKKYELVHRCNYCMEEGGSHEISCVVPVYANK